MSPGTEVLAPASRRVLELDRVLDGVAAFTQTEAGAARIRAYAPTRQRATIESRLRRFEALRENLRRNGGLGLAGVQSIDAILQAVAVRGVVLEPDALVRVRRLADASDGVRARFAGRGVAAEERNEIMEMVDGLPSFASLREQIDALVDADGSIRDDASPRLRELREHKQRGRARLHEKLERLARSGPLADALQENIVTERGGRLVLALRTSHRDRIQGVVHDTSSSRQTLFVEPLETVAEQNRMAELVGEERAEIQRLLAAASGHVAAASAALALAQETLARFDALQAVVRFADTCGCIVPDIGAATLDLVNARHPLLDPATVVPLQLSVPVATPVIVITGPNTGGKTVALKTVGLIAAMAQCGLPVPAERAALPLVPRIWADIGDEQSLEANLSTFSAHLAHIGEFLGDCPTGSLVIMDELGTGTDPTEGAALGMALLEEFAGLGAVVLVSTHHDALKSFAHREARAANAAMEFDPETLSPTYRLQVGRPGRSNALQIARRLGLDEDIVARARSLIADEVVQLDDVIRDVERQGSALEDERAEVAAERDRLVALQERLDHQTSKLDSRRAQLERDVEARVRDVVRELKSAGEVTIEKLRGAAPTHSERTLSDRKARWSGSIGELQSKALEELRRELEARPAGVGEASAKSSRRRRRGRKRRSAAVADELPAPLTSLARGAPVKVAPFGLEGTVLDDWNVDQGQTVHVDVGGKRLRVPVEQLALSQRLGKRGGTGYSFARRPGVRAELDLHGMTVEQAVAAVDKYLDDALLAGHHSVRLIHGFGTLRLRDAIRQYLAGRPDLSRFHAADLTDGGAGVTVVEFAG